MRPGFRMTIGADLVEVARVQAAFAEFAAAHELPVPVRRSITVALDELLSNTIRHGFTEGGREERGGQSGEVAIAVELHPDRVSVTLTDDGRPFDPLAASSPAAAPLPETTLPVAERPIGGLGIHLVRRMMDDVSYQRQADYNVVILSKRLAGGTTARPGGGRAMDMTTRTRNDVTIVAVAGALDTNTSPHAQQTLDGVVAGGAQKIVVDFTALDYISSAGLRVLLATAKRVSGPGVGGALRLFGLNETVREVFDISGFSAILPVYATEADALRGL